MAAPTIVQVKASTASGTGTLQFSSGSGLVQPSVGDLAVFIAMGNTTSLPSAVMQTGGSDDANWSQDATVDGSGTNRTRIWSKVLESSDFTGSAMKAVGPKSFVSSGTTRIALMAFAHASGWDSGRVHDTDTHNTNEGNGATVLSTTDPGRAFLAVVGGVGGGSTLQTNWDSAGAQDPYFDDGSGTDADGPNDGTNHYGTGATSTQADFKLYDSGGGAPDVTWSTGIANTTHAIAGVVYKVGTPTVSGTGTLTGGGTFAASGGPTKTGTGTLSGGGTFSASGTPTVIGTASLTGGGTFAAIQEGIEEIFGTASLTGGGTFTATGTPTTFGTATITGGGTFTSSGTRTVVGTVALAGGGTFSSSGDVAGLVSGSGGSWSTGGLHVAGGNTWTGTATLSGGGTFAGTGQIAGSQAGIGAFVGGGVLTAAGTRTVVGTATLSGGGRLDVAGAPRDLVWTFRLMPATWQMRLRRPSWSMKGPFQ